jgi:hypothetical protein
MPIKTDNRKTTYSIAVATSSFVIVVLDLYLIKQKAKKNAYNISIAFKILCKKVYGRK